MDARYIETNPEIIIQRYRERAAEYRHLAETSPDPASFLRIAETFETLAEGMEAIVRARDAPIKAVPEKISN